MNITQSFSTDNKKNQLLESFLFICNYNAVLSIKMPENIENIDSLSDELEKHGKFNGIE